MGLVLATCCAIPGLGCGLVAGHRVSTYCAKRSSSYRENARAMTNVGGFVVVGTCLMLWGLFTYIEEAQKCTQLVREDEPEGDMTKKGIHLPWG